MRAALRALAEMEPTKNMRDASYGYFPGYGDTYTVDECKAYILAAADEGKPQ